MTAFSVYDLVSEHGVVLLAGVVGSTAYGLSRRGSDEDRLGVFAAPTMSLLALEDVKETRVYSEPSDAAFHEARKYLRLALACNPTITELLWLDEYDICTPLGEVLVGIRRHFLSAPKVRDSYLGYARSQLKRLENRGDGTFSSSTANRSSKHARHMARLLEQGYSLYTRGELSVKVENPDWYSRFSEQQPEEWARWFHREAKRFEDAESCLPDRPKTDVVNEWLAAVRKRYLVG